ncbi:hypothetical protein AKJ09_06338 [Labilithrix luteola]|uniref:SnoaL-like domain-containing protein n=1 Tax=Labilithrix luteola TaxID=1391654 RepID=A0A0K1Q2Q9_9BACT|nr:hypothetical protein [Labilithrix luteola]AKU99674.1 hypothetical protein AKJ09_06338 [Labilithrix luteola]
MTASQSKLAIGAGCALVAVVVLWFTLFRPSEEARIQKTLDRLAKAVSVKADDNVIARAGRLRSELKEIATDDVSVDVREISLDVTGRDKVVDGATKAQMVFNSAAVELTSMTIKVDDAKTMAKADGVAIVTGDRGGERKVDRRDVHFLLRNDDGWRVTSIDVRSASSD